MKSFLFVITFASIALLSGCATNFEKQLDTYRIVQTERSKEGQAKYTSLQAIATGASDSTKQVALQAWQAVAMVENLAQGRGEREAMPAPPPTALDRGLQALSILAPIAGNVWTANYAKNIAINAQNNSAAVSLGDQRARVDSLAVVSNGNASIANGGFGALRGQGQDYAAAFRAALDRPTTQITVNGDGNTTGGRDATTTTTTTTTVSCQATQTGNGGAGAPGGNGGGAPGATGGAAGGGERSAHQATQNCAAQK